MKSGSLLIYLKQLMSTLNGRLDASDTKLTSVVTPSIIPVATNKILALTDITTIQKVTAAATLTVPPNSDVAFPVGSQISISVYTTGDVAVAAGSGVSVYSKDAKLKVDGQYAGATLTKMATDEWWLVGALKA